MHNKHTILIKDVHFNDFYFWHTASQWISWGLEKGSEKAGHFIRVGSSKIREHLHPEQPKPIDPKVQRGAEYARKGAHVAVSVSSYLGKDLWNQTYLLNM